MWARVTGFHVLRKRRTTAPTALSRSCDGSDEKVCCLIVPRIQIEVKTIVMLRTDN